jgi:hypothetical protein
MAATRKYAELWTVDDAIKVIERRVFEGGMRLDVIVAKAGVSPDEWEAVKALAHDERLTHLRHVARAAGVELMAAEAQGHTSWSDPHNPLAKAPRSQGLWDHHLTKL